MVDLCNKFKSFSRIVQQEKSDCISENKSKLFFKAINELCVTKFDKGLCNDNNSYKCDYIISGKKSLYLVELKGASNLSDAPKQLLTSLEILEQKYKNDFISGKIKLRAFIVSDSFSQIPKNINSVRTKLAKKLYQMSKYKEDCKDYSYCVKQVRTVVGCKELSLPPKQWDKIDCNGLSPVSLD
ncbi:hypothetical protein [uncultured Campylobacter sp.]|uniref:hypothetical protein n=1 Tax=uncultured Campylobacter sp. TaxID=218934 RepID=UPI002636FCD6|nr:hypothetical protein [uncultured Campylobacter sp.]